MRRTGSGPRFRTQHDVAAFSFALRHIDVHFGGAIATAQPATPASSLRRLEPAREPCGGCRSVSSYPSLKMSHFNSPRL